MSVDKKYSEILKKKLNKLVGYGIWLLILLLTLSLVRNWRNRERVKKEVAAEAARLAKMKEDNTKLGAEIAQTQGNAFIEKEIRNKLGLVKEGEVVIVLPDEETLRKLAPPVVFEEDVLPDPNWKRWLKLFL